MTAAAVTSAYVILFSVAGQAGFVAMHGGATHEACRARAREIIADIRRGTEAMGMPYRSIEYRCHQPNGGKP